jgi:predicted dehydrogenase
MSVRAPRRLSERRRFLGTSAAVGSGLALGYFVNPAAAKQSSSPNEKLNLAAVGVTGRAGENVRGCSSENIVAAADVDQSKLDEGTKALQGVRKYKDFRVMLEKEGDKIDGVLVGTPDHTHAPAAAMALRLKKHVYCEKPLTHTVFEARTLANLAKENKLATQMGNQIHAGDNYRRVVELVQSGAIGEVKEAHVWVNVNYSGAKFETGDPVPAGLDWDLWLGPAAERPYSKNVHPFQWRRFWDFGTGGLGDFGCHFMDLTHWALKLRAPTTVSAEGSPVDKVSCPAWTIVTYEYPNRGELPPVKVMWYDGGKRPEILNTLQTRDGKPLDFGAGQLFVGSKGMIISDYSRHLLLPEEKFLDFKRPEQTIPSSIGHHNEWIQAIKSGSVETTCNFDYAGALTEAVLLGTVAYRAGKAIEWDAANLKVLNSPEAQQLIHKEYRKGWTL